MAPIHQIDVPEDTADALKKLGIECLPVFDQKTNLKDYVFLEGKTHGNYSYLDLLVCKYRLHGNPNLQAHAKQLGISYVNTAQENNGRNYVGDIKWADSLKLNLSQGNKTLSPRQFIDFRKLLKSGKAFDGNGKRIDSKELDNILDEIFAVRNPWRSEWLDADFKVENGQLYLLSNHSLKNGILVPNYKANIEGKYLDSDSMIDEKSFNEFGLATKKGKDFCQWFPRKDNNSVAGFGAGSVRADLDCYWGPGCSDSSLGVRGVREAPRKI